MELLAPFVDFRMALGVQGAPTGAPKISKAKIMEPKSDPQGSKSDIKSASFEISETLILYDSAMIVMLCCVWEGTVGFHTARKMWKTRARETQANKASPREPTMTRTQLQRLVEPGQHPSEYTSEYRVSTK